MYSQNDWRNYSSKELYHHGILGMHWGIRRYQNSDGSLTEEGRKRYSSLNGSHKMNISTTKNPMQTLEDNAKKTGQDLEKAKDALRKEIVDQLEKDFKNSKYDNWSYESTVKNIQPVIDEIKNDKRIQKAIDENRKANRYCEDFLNDKEAVEKYATLAGIVNANMMGYDEADKKNMVWGYKYEDFDQGAGNSFSLYLMDKGVDNNAYDTESFKARKNATDTINSVTKEYMGSYYDTRLTDSKSGRTNRVSNILTSAIDDQSGNIEIGWADDVSFDNPNAWRKELEKAKKEYKKYKDI